MKVGRHEGRMCNEVDEEHFGIVTMTCHQDYECKREYFMYFALVESGARTLCLCLCDLTRKQIIIVCRDVVSIQLKGWRDGDWGKVVC